MIAGKVGMAQARQEREDRMARTQQKDRAAGTGQLRWDSHDSEVGARLLGHDIDYDAGQDSPDRSVWTGQPDRSAHM
jgi:hypothetical protein